MNSNAGRGRPRTSRMRIVSPPNPARGGGRGDSPPLPGKMATMANHDRGMSGTAVAQSHPRQAVAVAPRYPQPMLPHLHPQINHQHPVRVKPYHHPPPPYHPPMNDAPNVLPPRYDYATPPYHHGRLVHGALAFPPGPPPPHHHRVPHGPPHPPPHLYPQPHHGPHPHHSHHLYHIHQYRQPTYDYMPAPQHCHPRPVTATEQNLAGANANAEGNADAYANANAMPRPRGEEGAATPENTPHKKIAAKATEDAGMIAPAQVTPSAAHKTNSIRGGVGPVAIVNAAPSEHYARADMSYVTPAKTARGATGSHRCSAWRESEAKASGGVRDQGGAPFSEAPFVHGISDDKRVTGTADQIARDAGQGDGTTGGEGEGDKLAPVDAIFAAAEVIARRPSPQRPFIIDEGQKHPQSNRPAIIHHSAAMGAKDVHHGTATIDVSEGNASAFHSEGVSKSSEAAVSPLKPKRPFKKRKVQSPTKTPGQAFLGEGDPPAGPQPSPERDRRRTSRALLLGRTIEAEPALYRALLMHMALERETPRRPGGGAGPDTGIGRRRGNQYVEGVRAPGPGVGGGKVIADGFFWRDVPELEEVLREHMEGYYEMSENRPQSKKQQQFNNNLVKIIRETALRCGYTFDPISFGSSGAASSQRTPASSSQTHATEKPCNCGVNKGHNLGHKLLPAKANKGGGRASAAEPPAEDDNFNHKKLRDRIRCYYKTHVQNSKKRLVTLLKDPARPKNRDVLLRIVEDLKACEARAEQRGAVAVDGEAMVGMGPRLWDKLCPSGGAALRRLEAQEHWMGFVGAPPVATGPGAEASTHLGHNALSRPATATGMSAASSPSSSGSMENSNCTQSTWNMPPSPRRVSVDVKSYQLGSDINGSNAKFASPCKPEHAAMLQSIRSVSVQLDVCDHTS